MIKDIGKYRFYYENSFKILKSVFRNLGKEDFEDFFQTAYMLKYEVFQNNYDASKGTELSFLIKILKNEILTQIRSNKLDKEKLLKIDFQDLMEENKVNRYIANAISLCGIPENPTPEYIMDFLFSEKIEKGLITAHKIKDKRNEAILFNNNLQCLKRKVWTSKNVINEENFKSIVSGEIKGIETPLHYKFSDPMPVIKIKCWIACSKID